VTVCPAARSGVGGTVPGVLLPSLQRRLSAIECTEATRARKQQKTTAGIHNSDR
jgi:hypothetical protein